jgi:hypothetical protein
MYFPVGRSREELDVAIEVGPERFTVCRIPEETIDAAIRVVVNAFLRRFWQPTTRHFKL